MILAIIFLSLLTILAVATPYIDKRDFSYGSFSEWENRLKKNHLI